MSRFCGRKTSATVWVRQRRARLGRSRLLGATSLLQRLQRAVREGQLFKPACLQLVQQR